MDKHFYHRNFLKSNIVQLTNKAGFQGISYSFSMLLVYGSTDGLPDFAEILQIIVCLDQGSGTCGSLGFTLRLRGLRK